jgi:ABC-2 type transport system permease protein
MSTVPALVDVSSGSRRSLTRIFIKESKYELLKLAREPMYSMFVIGFPMMFFLLFGLPNNKEVFHGYPFARYLIASYSCFGAMGASLFAIGGGIAQERGYFWLELKRSSAMPVSAYLFAKLVASMFFGITVTIALLILGSVTIKLQIDVFQALHLIVAILGSVVMFASMGIVAGLLLPPSSAAGMINFIYLPLSLLSGLWMPLEVLPSWMQDLAKFLPSYYSSRLALHTLGYFNDNEMQAWLMLLLYSVIFLAAAAWLFRRQETAR